MHLPTVPVTFFLFFIHVILENNILKKKTINKWETNKSIIKIYFSPKQYDRH